MIKVPTDNTTSANSEPLFTHFATPIRTQSELRNGSTASAAIRVR